MAFNRTNLLETTAQANNGDFLFYDRAGAQGPVAAANTAGEWCANSGSTASNGTGPSANPSGRAGYIYTESSTPSASTVWRFQRNTVFDTTAESLVVNLIYNLNADIGSTVFIEYATAANPNETTDWSILETIPCTATDLWISDSFDFSGIVSTTLRVRVRLSTLNDFTNDIAFSTWNEVGEDLAASAQEGFRFRNDNGSESGASFRQAQDVADTVGKQEAIRLRMLTDISGNPAGQRLRLQYKRSDEPASEWRDV